MPVSLGGILRTGKALCLLSGRFCSSTRKHVFNACEPGSHVQRPRAQRVTQGISQTHSPKTASRRTPALSVHRDSIKMAIAMVAITALSWVHAGAAGILNDQRSDVLLGRVDPECCLTHEVSMGPRRSPTLKRSHVQSSSERLRARPHGLAGKPRFEICRGLHKVCLAMHSLHICQQPHIQNSPI